MRHIKRVFRKFMSECLWRLPHKTAHSIIYRKQHGARMNWSNPVTYDEKIHWLMTYRLDKSYGKYADKYEVREYVKQCGCDDILIPLSGGVYNSADDIDFDALEYPCILKATHGSGMKCYEIVREGGLDEDKVSAIRKKLNAALKTRHEKRHCEYHYASIKARIICEKLLGSGDEQLTDYKVVCSKGEPKAVLVCQNRNKGRDYYTLDWEHTEFTKKECQSGRLVERPKGLDRMLEAAAALSKPFELARVDFYDIDGKVYFGEITLSPSSGGHNYLSDEGQQILGSYISLDL